MEFPFKCRGRSLRVIITPGRVVVMHEAKDEAEGDGIVGNDSSCRGYSGNKSAAGDDAVGKANARALSTQPVIIECAGGRKCIAKGQNAEFILK